MKWKRTNPKRLSMPSVGGKALSSWTDFIAANRLLLLFTLLFLGGVLLGVLIFALSESLLAGDLGMMLAVGTIEGGFGGCVTALFSSCFSILMLLALMFLFGLSACGAPFAVLVPLFFGMGLGLTEAYYFSMGLRGLAISALLIVPHYLIAAVALLLGSMESIRMSLLFSRQLLPGGGMGGLWADFKMYCVRYLVFLCLALASGVADVCLRLLFGPLLS